MDAAGVVIHMLGPVTLIFGVGEAAQQLIPSLTRAGEGLIRSMAANPHGVSVIQIKHQCDIKGGDRRVHDAANKLRGELQPFGLTVSRAHRPGYRLTDLRGGSVRVQSDLDALNTIAEKLPVLRREQLDDGGSPDTLILEASLGDLDEVIKLWRGDDQSYPRRLEILNKLKTRQGDRLLIDVDRDVRLERARRSVALARKVVAQNWVIYARRAVEDFDAPDDEAQELRRRFHRELTDIQRLLTDQIASVNESPDVFLAVPMLATDDYEGNRQRAKRIIEALQQHCGVGEVFWAGQTIEDAHHFEEPSVGLGRNMPFFRSATKFVMVYPEKIASGVLVEAGIAMALRAPAVYFVRERKDLPWILRDVGGANDGQLGPVRVIEYSDDDDLVERIRTNANHLFPDVRS